MEWFIMSMILFPACQKRAQDELDEVVGRGRLPTFADLPQLVYIRALTREVFRWRGVAPLGKLTV